jgi:hypothetical protein
LNTHLWATTSTGINIYTLDPKSLRDCKRNQIHMTIFTISSLLVQSINGMSATVNEDGLFFTFKTSNIATTSLASEDLAKIKGLQDLLDNVRETKSLLLPVTNFYMPAANETTSPLGDIYLKFVESVKSKFGISWSSEIAQIDMTAMQKRYICDRIMDMLQDTWPILSRTKTSESYTNKHQREESLAIISSEGKGSDSDFDKLNLSKHSTITIDGVTLARYPPSHAHIGDPKNRTAALVPIPIEHMEEPSEEERSRRTDLDHVKDQKKSLISSSAVHGSFIVNVVPYEGESAKCQFRQLTA